MEGSTAGAGGEFTVELIGDRERVRVDLDDRIELGTVAIDRFDARQIDLNDLAAGQPPRVHRRAHLGNRDLFDLRERR